MHELFPDWYRVADPNATREVVAKRSDATDEVVGSITKKQAAELAGYIARPRQEAPAWFQKTYKTHDELMLTRAIDAELRILAGITLRVTLEPMRQTGAGGEVPVAAGLSLLTGAFGMKDEPTWLKEHLHAAAEGLSKVGRQVRHTHGPLSVATPLTPESVNEAFGSTKTAMDAIAEMNDYLWWALTKHSRLLTQTYESLPPEVVALTAPADLFHYVRTVPVAPETETLLLHVLLQMSGARETEFSFRNYVSSFGRERAEKLVQPCPSACTVLCPIMWSISAIASAKTWQSEFEKFFGFRTATKFPAQSMTIQFLRELCLAKIFAGSD